MNKMILSLALVAAIVTPSSAQFYDPIAVQAIDTIIVRNVVDSPECEVREYREVSDQAMEHLRTTFATPDIETVARLASDDLLTDCDRVFAFIDKTTVIERMEAEAAIINHPVIQQQMASDAALMNDVYASILTYLDKNK